MAHGNTNIFFAVDHASDVSDRAFGYYFANEHNAPASLAEVLPADVKAQIHLVKVGVERNRERSEEPCADEAEADQTNKCAARKSVQLGTAREVLQQQCGIYVVIQHYKVKPLR